MKVFIAQPIQPNGIEMLKKVAEVVESPKKRPLERSEFLSQIKDVEAIVLPWHTDVMDKEAFTVAKKLKIIARHGVGYENIDLEEATRRGIYVTICPVHTKSVADTAFTLIVCAARKITQADHFVKSKKWIVGGEWVAWKFMGIDLHDKTLGVIGAGRIGADVLRRGTGFNMDLLYFDVESKPELEKEIGAKKVSLETLLKESDFVSVNTNLTEKTKNLISGKEFEIMKKKAVIVNTSRGPVIDEKALYQALKNKRIAAAGLDVYQEEPLPLDSPLLGLENVILLPHIGSAALEMRYKMAEVTCQSVIDVFAGKEPKYLLNSEIKNKQF